MVGTVGSGGPGGLLSGHKGRVTGSHPHMTVASSSAPRAKKDLRMTWAPGGLHYPLGPSRRGMGPSARQCTPPSHPLHKRSRSHGKRWSGGDPARRPGHTTHRQAVAGGFRPQCGNIDCKSHRTVARQCQAQCRNVYHPLFKGMTQPLRRTTTHVLLHSDHNTCGQKKRSDGVTALRRRESAKKGGGGSGVCLRCPRLHWGPLQSTSNARLLLQLWPPIGFGRGMGHTPLK